MQLDRTIRALRKLVKPALAGGLVVLLLFTTTASASHLLHRALHSGDSTPDHNCIVCLFAKGQVSAVDGLAIGTVFVAAFFFALRSNFLSVLTSIDLRLTPSRGPPASPASS